MTGHIAIEGIVGAGKTTVARLIAERTGAMFLGEASETHPFLDAFYSDPARYALETELAFLLIHYHQLFHRGATPVVTDFCLAKDLIFARMNLCGKDLEHFEELFKHLSHNIAAASSVFFLRLPIPVCIKRIRARGIPREQSVTPRYLTALENAYVEHARELGESVRILDIEDSFSSEAVAALILQLI